MIIADHSLEFLTETPVVELLRASVPSIKWMHFEHEEVDERTAYGIVKLDRGEPGDDGVHDSTLSIRVEGARDQDFRAIDEAISCPDAFLALLNSNNGIFVNEHSGFAVERQHLAGHSLRTYTASVSVGYQTQN